MAADVNSNLASWSTSEASNSPAGSTAISTNLDDNLRQIQATVRTYLATKAVDIASATTTDLSTVAGNFVDVTGTTTITGFGTLSAGMWKVLQFDGALTLTHNATSLILPGAANITTAAGDCLFAYSLDSGNWTVPFYQRASGTSPFVDSNAIVVGSSDATKKLRFEVDTNVGAGTTRALTIPSADGVVSTTTKTDGTPLFPTVIPQISASVGSSALTISCSELNIDFRSATLTSGTVTRVLGTPANLVISSGSTLGTINAIQSRIVVLAINNAGTIELAAVNISGGNDLTETGVISTTAEGGAGAADSATVIYSTTARSNLAYRVIGYVESTQATAGTWATTPSTIQGSGGNAVTAMSSIGYGQTWQDVSGSRALSTTYYNTTGRPIMVSVGTYSATSGGITTMTINSVSPGKHNAATGATQAGAGTYLIPANASYSVTSTATTPIINIWFELR